VNVIEFTPTGRPAQRGIEVPRDLVVQFGKRKGLSVSWIAENDLSYALWLMSQGFMRRTQPQLWLCLRRHVVRVLSDQEADHDARRFA